MGIPQLLLYLMIVIYFASLWKIFLKAGRTKKWEGFVPIYNIVVWLKILKRPWWWIFFFFIPFINFVVLIACNVETGRLFGKYSAKETILCVLCPWYFIPFLGYDDKNQVVEPTNWEKKEDREKRSVHDQLALFFISLGVGNVLLTVFRFAGSKDKPGKKTMAFEWTNAIGFAVVAATIIRTFFFEAFTIPTGSMEKTMRIGDYLFVNKVRYGARLPMTPIAIPFVHNRIPGTFAKSFVEWFKIDYTRLPGYANVERNDIVVFNWPVGDSVLLHKDIVAHDYYAIVRNEAIYPYVVNGSVKTKEDFAKIADKAIALKRQQLIEGAGLMHQYSENKIESTQGLQTLPLDKKENYIKRCVAIAGDDLELIQGMLHIDGIEQPLPPESQFQYTFFFKPGQLFFSKEYLDEEFEVYNQDVHTSRSINPKTGLPQDVMIMSLTQDVYNQLKMNPGLDTSLGNFEALGHDYVSTAAQYCPIFPNHPSFDWSRDNFGPLHIPEEGYTIELTEKNYIMYKRAITAYEHNTLEKKQDGYYLNGKKATSYTFKQNYYWLMGDNRHGSVDSRYWGFVPEDHVVGTASFVWMSKHPEKGWFSGGLRWERVFSFVD